MLTLLLLMFALLSTSSPLSNLAYLQPTELPKPLKSSLVSINPNSLDLDAIALMLHQEQNGLREPVINKVLTSLKCSAARGLGNSPILTVIDYSLPSNQKRLWVFDLRAHRLLFYTYVSHGLNSGTLDTNYFSNKNNSKASSLGIYRTEKAYYGRHGLSLQLAGLEAGFNDNAARRSVVLHGGWYVEEPFIKRYGRAGRSWGCPAVPDNLTKAIVNTIKDNSLFVVYYPSDNWFAKSKFLTCNRQAPSNAGISAPEKPHVMEDQNRPENIVYIDLNKNGRQDDSDPILAVDTDFYEQAFQSPAPLNRMLRRQVGDKEYIALSDAEFEKLLMQGSVSKAYLDNIHLVVPEIRMVRGYYETLMKVLPDKIRDISSADLSNPSRKPGQVSASLNSRPSVTVKTSNHFIRWIGL